MKILLNVSTIIVAGAIAYLSLRPSVQMAEVNDKVGHFIAYFVLMLNIGLATWKRKREVLLALYFTVGYGVLMEFGQYFVPGRDFSLLDMFANAAGAVLGAGLLLLFGRKIILLLGIKEKR